MMPWFPSSRAAGTVPALFMHIQKTAGTSLVNMARHYYGSSIVSHADYCSSTPEELSKYNFVSGHFGYAYARRLMSGRYTFTFLRDPLERVLSFYFFCRSRELVRYEIYRLAHDHELPEFLEMCMADPFLKMQVWNNQVWQLAYGYTLPDTLTLEDFSPDQLLELSKDHLQAFSLVGFTETFDKDAATICQALKFPRRRRNQPYLKENATPQRPQLSDQPASTREMLMKITELDRELYSYARGLAMQPAKSWFVW